MTFNDWYNKHLSGNPCRISQMLSFTWIFNAKLALKWCKEKPIHISAFPNSQHNNTPMHKTTPGLSHCDTNILESSNLLRNKVDIFREPGETWRGGFWSPIAELFLRNTSGNRMCCCGVRTPRYMIMYLGVRTPQQHIRLSEIRA